MPIYHDAGDRRRFLSFSFCDRPVRVDLSRFCLMTNHYHLVLETTRANLSDGMQVFNGEYAQGFNGKYRRWGHVFGERFWSRPLAEDELEQVCIYVMMNPVRAGLCNEMEDWPWSACRYELG